MIGWDSVRYFWTKKTPKQTASDLSSVLLAYSAKWHADRVALIGFSFGADIIPSVYNRLRRKPQGTGADAFALIIPSRQLIAKKPGPLGWLGAPPSAGAIFVGPAIEKRIPAELIQCFYGKKDAGSYCPDLAGQGAEVLEKDGTHHFDGNYLLIAHQILDGFERRIAEGDHD